MKKFLILIAATLILGSASFAETKVDQNVPTEYSEVLSMKYSENLPAGNEIVDGHVFRSCSEDSVLVIFCEGKVYVTKENQRGYSVAEYGGNSTCVIPTKNYCLTMNDVIYEGFIFDWDTKDCTAITWDEFKGLNTRKFKHYCTVQKVDKPRNIHRS